MDLTPRPGNALVLGVAEAVDKADELVFEVLVKCFINCTLLLLLGRVVCIIPFILLSRCDLEFRRRALGRLLQSLVRAVIVIPANIREVSPIPATATIDI